MGPAIAERVAARTNEELIEMVRVGLPGMPGFLLVDDAMRDLVGFLRTLQPGQAKAPKPDRVETAEGRALEGIVLNRSSLDLQLRTDDGRIHLLRKAGERYRVTSSADWVTYHGNFRGGWNVLAIDMQYFGERSTDLLSTFTDQEKHDRLYNQPSLYLDWVVQTLKDIGRSYDYLVKERGADPKRIGLIGLSRGATVAAVAGGADRRLAAVVVMGGGHFDAREREHLPVACPANYIGRISPRPLLMLQGKYDTDFVSETSVEPLYRLARRPKQILWFEGGHSFPPEESQSAMLKWLGENLK